MPSVLIADDHAMMRTGLRHYLEQDRSIDPIAETGSGEETLQELRNGQWDLVILDIYAGSQWHRYPAAYTEAARVPRAKSDCQRGQNQLAHATERLAGGPRTRGLSVTAARHAPP